MKVLEIRQLQGFIADLRGPITRAAVKATIQTAQNAAAGAQRNAQRNFKGTPDRPKRGFLQNAIFAGYDIQTKAGSRYMAEAFVAVRANKGNEGTKPYGRIHEEGGTIKPVHANSLWIPQFGPGSTGDLAQFKNMTPTLFMAAMQGKTLKSGLIAGFAILGGAAGFFKWVAGKGKTVRSRGAFKMKFIALFILKKQVTIPARPYIAPSIAFEMPKFKSRFDRFLKAES